MMLSSYIQGRDNNFNLIRVVAALTVMVSHSFTVATGLVETEPCYNNLGMSIGSIAVDVFFLTSGFLVTSSLLNRQSILEFIWARVLRIFPALLVMLLLVVFILGVFFTILPTVVYFSSPQTYIYFKKCLVLFTDVEYSLPGVFDANPYKSVVNASLWTMPHEVRMYAILAITWIVLGIRRGSRLEIFLVFVVTLTVVAGANLLVDQFSANSSGRLIRLFFMFFAGASFYILRKYIVVSRALFWGFAMALVAVGGASKNIFFVVYLLVLPYLLFYLAYVPAGFVRQYNRMDDYSYGIYIYAFPVQQAVIALAPGISVLQLMLVSGVIVILLAALSWNLVEQGSLRRTGYFIDCTRRWCIFVEGLWRKL